jgi:hypothetical protein
MWKKHLYLIGFVAMALAGSAQSNSSGKPVIFVEGSGGLSLLNPFQVGQGADPFDAGTQSYYDDAGLGFTYGGAFGVYLTKKITLALAVNISAFNFYEEALIFRGSNDSLYMGIANDNVKMTDVGVRFNLVQPISSNTEIHLVLGAGFISYNNQRVFLENQLTETAVGLNLNGGLRINSTINELICVFVQSSYAFNSLNPTVSQAVYVNPALSIPQIQNFDRLDMTIGVQFNFLSGIF